jgi:ABC-type sugar transport system permease subunit
MPGKGLSKRKLAENLADVIFISPQLLLYLLYTICPFIIAIPIVFMNKTNLISSSADFIGLGNFVSVFKPPIVNEFLPVMQRTLVYTLINYGTVFAFGIPLALLMFEFTSRFKNAFFTVIYMPYIISGLGVGMMLMMLFSKDSGTLNLLLMKLNIIHHPIDIMNPHTGVLALPLIEGWQYAGFNMALFLGGLLSVPCETIDAARVDGVNYLQRLWYVYFPQMIPNIVIACIFCLMGSFNSFDVAVGFGGLRGNSSAYMVALMLYKMSFGAGASQSATLSQTVTLSMIIYLPLFLIAVLINKLQRKYEY